jgi:hypothetical protein
MVHTEGNKNYIYSVLHALNEAIKIPIIWLSSFIEFAYVERPVARLLHHRVDLVINFDHQSGCVLNI